MKKDRVLPFIIAVLLLISLGTVVFPSNLLNGFVPAAAASSSDNLIITKHPYSETIQAGTSTSFVAKAAYASSVKWTVTDAYGNTIDEAKWPDYRISIASATTNNAHIVISRAPVDLNGWSFYATFTGYNGAVAKTDAAILNVYDPKAGAPSIPSPASTIIPIPTAPPASSAPATPPAVASQPAHTPALSSQLSSPTSESSNNAASLSNTYSSAPVRTPAPTRAPSRTPFPSPVSSPVPSPASTMIPLQTTPPDVEPEGRNHSALGLIALIAGGGVFLIALIVGGIRSHSAAKSRNHYIRHRRRRY